MKIYKWIGSHQPPLADIEWCIASNIKVNIDHTTKKINVGFGKSYDMHTGSDVTFVIHNEKEELLFLLRFIDKVYLYKTQINYDASTS